MEITSNDLLKAKSRRRIERAFVGIFKAATPLFTVKVIDENSLSNAKPFVILCTCQRSFCTACLFSRTSQNCDIGLDLALPKWSLSARIFFQKMFTSLKRCRISGVTKSLVLLLFPNALCRYNSFDVSTVPSLMNTCFL